MEKDVIIKNRASSGYYRVKNGFIINLRSKEKENLLSSIKKVKDLFPDTDANSNPKWIENVVATIEDKYNKVTIDTNKITNKDLAKILDDNRSKLERLSLVNLRDCVLMVTSDSVFLGDYEYTGTPKLLMDNINKILSEHSYAKINYQQKDFKSEENIIHEEEDEGSSDDE